MDGKIGGSLNCAGSTFAGPSHEALSDTSNYSRPKSEIEPCLFMDVVRVGGDLLLNNGFRAHREVRALGAHVHGDIQCEKGTFAKELEDPTCRAISFDGSRIDGTVAFVDGFRVYGRLSVPYCTVGGRLLFHGQIHARGAAFNGSGLRVTGDVRYGMEMPGSIFISGKVTLPGARIGQNLLFDRGEYVLARNVAKSTNDYDSKNPRAFAVILAEGTEIDGMVRFGRGCHLKGTAWMVGSRIGQDLICTGSYFDKPSNADVRYFPGDYIAFNTSRSRVAGEFRCLPIRLTPMTATCRVPPLSRVKLGIGWSRGVARDAEQ